MQILGGVGNPGAEVHATQLTRRLANLVSGTATLLPAPGAVGSADARRVMLKDRYVQEATALFKSVTVALVGIGAVEPSKLLAASGNVFSPQELKSLSGAWRGRRHLPALLRRRRRAGASRRSTTASSASSSQELRARQPRRRHRGRQAQDRGHPRRAAGRLDQRADHRSQHGRAALRAQPTRGRSSGAAGVAGETASMSMTRSRRHVRVGLIAAGDLSACWRVLRPWTIVPIETAAARPFDAAAYVVVDLGPRVLRDGASRSPSTWRPCSGDPPSAARAGVAAGADGAVREGHRRRDRRRSAIARRAGARAARRWPTHGRRSRIQVGPVLRGTALRDALGFIRFTDFANQFDFAGVANALNDRVLATVLGPLDVEALAGQRRDVHRRRRRRRRPRRRRRSRSCRSSSRSREEAR